MTLEWLEFDNSENFKTDTYKVTIKPREGFIDVGVNELLHTYVCPKTKKQKVI